MSPRLILLAAATLGLFAAAATALDFGKLSKDVDLLNKAKETKTTLDDANKLVSDIGPEEERLLGQTVALEIISRFGGLVRDDETMRRVNLIGHALARYSIRPDHAWRFGVLDSDTVNAFSAPDGYVFITRGLYQTADDDEQLAAILGHEIAHITGRHALTIVGRGEKLSIVAKEFSKRSTDVRQIDAYASQLDLSVEKIVKFLIEKGFDPQTEYAADQNGRALAAVTGYAPGGLRRVLAKLQQRGGDPKKIFSTHPPLKERIKRLPDEPAAAPGPPAS